MDDGIIRRVQRLAAEAVGQNGRLAVMFVADDAAVAMLARDLASLEVEGIAVGTAGGVTHHADMAVVLDPAKLDVVRDVGQDEVFPHAVPGWSLSPEHARVQAPDWR